MHDIIHSNAFSQTLSGGKMSICFQPKNVNIYYKILKQENSSYSAPIISVHRNTIKKENYWKNSQYLTYQSENRISLSTSKTILVAFYFAYYVNVVFCYNCIFNNMTAKMFSDALTHGEADKIS